MKVFNWVHRKFLHVDIRSHVAFMQEDGKRSSQKVDCEKHALLEHDDHDLVAPNWENGILAIGTLGLPIGPFDEKIPTQCSNETTIKEMLVPHGDRDDHDDEEENNHALVDHLHNEKYDEHENLMNHELFRHELEKAGSGCKEIEEVGEEDNAVEMKENNESKKESQVSRRRVTLADLFLEDSDHHAVPHVANSKQAGDECSEDKSIAIQMASKIKKKKATLAKNGFTKAKKLLKDDFRPHDMFSQLMKRMIKRKIHPDLEAKMQKDIQMRTTRKENGAHESASLSLIQDVMV